MPVAMLTERRFHHFFMTARAGVKPSVRAHTINISVRNMAGHPSSYFESNRTSNFRANPSLIPVTIRFTTPDT